ncbi:MAG TPA: hypothetical protein VIL88_03720 [Devosia sp.]|jgi:hypothetical protein|uniref:hypothetical protein n=1 Tax=Devosia sp. TaxID=1871048 RepID=UPI002F92EDE2
MRIWVLLFSVAALSACSGPNSGLNTLQFSQEAYPFPANYQIEAARLVRDRGLDRHGISVSYPQQTIGSTVSSPRRWYVCLSGVPDPIDRSTRLPPLSEWIGGWMDRQPPRYDLVLFFSEASRRPSVREGTNSALCRDARLEALTAQPPVI